MQFGFLAENACLETVFCPGIFDLVSALCNGAGMEKKELFYQGVSSFFTADRPIWHHDSFADVIFSLFVAVLSDVAACLCGCLGRHTAADGKRRAGTGGFDSIGEDWSK